MRKLMWFSAGFALATIIGLCFLSGSWYFLASGVAALLLCLSIILLKRFPKSRVFAGILFGLFLGFLWMTMFEHHYLSIPRTADGKKMVLTLTATDYSEDTKYGSVVDGIGKINDRNYKIRIYLPKDADIHPGDTLTGSFTLRSTLAGCTGESQFQFSRGIFFTAKTNRMPTVTKADRVPWFAYPATVRQQIINAINSTFPEDTAGFALALLIVDSDGIDYETDTSFKVSGISHIIAVSGFHVTVLFALVHTLLGKNRVLSAIIGLLVLFFFAAIAGFSPSITRACIMHSLMIIGTLFDQEYDPLTALGFAVLSMLIVNPCTIVNVSFQLSVMCMLGILLLSDPIKVWIMERDWIQRQKGKRKKLAGGIAASVGMSVGATVFVTPLCADYFRMVSLAGILTNPLTLWVISIIFYGIIAVCIISLIYHPIGVILAGIVSLPIRYVLAIAKLIARFPLSAVFTNCIYIVIWLILVYALLIVHLLVKRKQLVLTICCGVIGLCIAIMASWTQPLQDECRVTVLDVGQGQCILLQSEGKTYMVDCGSELDTQAATIATNQLMSQGVFRLDGLILTHFDLDHAGGVPYLLSRIPADVIYYPRQKDEQGTISQIQRLEMPQLLVEHMTNITFGSAQITLIPSNHDQTGNDASLCILFQTENCDILITGDRSSSGERELMRQVDLPELELLIVGHHGSKNSTSNALLQKTNPETAIISVGADNRYGHPADETIVRLQENGCIVYRTDLHGTVIFRR